jgi:hypothetical protein
MNLGLPVAQKANLVSLIEEGIDLCDKTEREATAICKLATLAVHEAAKQERQEREE